jgi:OFA family oxalate/formate antiporter-like MFS transporter
MMNVDTLKKARWLVVVGALLIQLALGAIYAWSAFTTALKNPEGDFRFTYTETLLIFAAGLASFAIVMVLAGKMQAKKGPRITAALGGLILGLGYVIGGFVGHTFITQLIFIGLVGGAGIGLAYVCPIAVGMKWFPDKKGLITGLAVAGFGFGALIWIYLAGPLGHLVENYGVLNTFKIYGIAFFVMVELGALVMLNPPDGWKPEGWEPSVPKEGEKAAIGTVDYEPNEMLKRPQFFGLWVCFIFSAFAGLMTIGVIKLFGSEALKARTNLSPEEISSAIALAFGVFYALSNGIGRIAWGTLSDYLGRKRSIFIMTLTQGIMMALFYFCAGNVALLCLSCAVIGFNFGGNFALFPTATADFFGTKNVGRNYGWMFTAYGVGGILGAIIPGILKDSLTGLEPWLYAFLISAALCIIAAVIILVMKPPKKETA